MSRMQTISIDSAKLKAEFAKRGLSMTDASRGIGLSSNYFACTTCKRNKISIIAANALKNEYNIDPESYAVEPSTTPPVVVEAPKDSAEANVLYDIMFNAAYDAMKKVMSE